MLSNMLPSTSHAQQLIKGELILDELKDITLLYSDMKGFTQLSSNMPARWPAFISLQSLLSTCRFTIAVSISCTISSFIEIILNFIWLCTPFSQLCTLLNVMYTSFDKHLDHFGLYKIGNFFIRILSFLSISYHFSLSRGKILLEMHL